MAPAGEEPLQLSDFQAETIRGTSGFVRVGRARSGAWWLVDSGGRPAFACGLGASRAFPADDPLARVELALVGPDGRPATGPGVWLGAVRFTTARPQSLIHFQGVRVPDVFDPDWRQACHELAGTVCRAGLADPRLVGWLPDPDLQWQQPAEGLPRPSLLQVCLSLEPSFAAYHAAWEFVLAAHGGDLGAVAGAWETSLPNKESLRLLTHDDQVLSAAGHWLDAEGFAREFARAWFATVSAAIRAHDPDHLVLAPVTGATPPAVADGAAPTADLLAIGPGLAPDNWQRHGAKPVFLLGTEWPPELLAAAAGNPAVVGWAAWHSGDPASGRSAAGPGLTRVDDATGDRQSALTDAVLLAVARRRAFRP